MPNHNKVIIIIKPLVPFRIYFCTHTDILTSSPIYVRCNLYFLSTDTSIGYRSPNKPNMNDGEVALFPTNKLNISASFGMVAIKCGKEAGDWKSISVDDPNSLSKNLLDTLCRGLGYTNAVPNSARTFKYYSDINYTFVETDHV